MALMKSSPCTLSLLILSTSPLFGLGTVVVRRFVQFTMLYTHQEAQEYCQRNHSGLALVLSSSEEDQMKNLYSAWVGLTKVTSFDGQGRWKWNSNQNVDNSLWAAGFPVDGHTCAFVQHSSRRFRSSSCEKSFFFICFIGGKYKFFSEPSTWSQAQNFCKSHAGDLATFDEEDSLKHVKEQDFPVWIKQDPTGLSSDGECVAMSAKSQTAELTNCSHRFPFMCSNDNVFLVKEEKSWEEAVEHCRALGLSPSQDGTLSSYQLLSVQAQDQDFLSTKTSEALSDEVWVGLRFLGGTWFWTNGVPMDDPELPVCPPPGKHCGVLSKQAVGVLTADCAEKKNFLCYKL